MLAETTINSAEDDQMAVRTDLPFRRVYFDIDPPVYEKMVQRAKAAKLTQKAYLQQLVEADAAKAAKK